MPLNLPPQEYGTVYWLTGLAGAGKTTIGRLLATKLREQQKNVVFLDGDIIREVLGATTGHGRDDRLALAQKYAAMSQMLSRQGMNVVCATISMFHQVRDWNRLHIHNYCEIYLRVPMPVLVARDQKGLYGQALAGAIDNVIGVNAPFEEPETPDIIIDNDGTRSPEAIIEELLSKIPSPLENLT